MEPTPEEITALQQAAEAQPTQATQPIQPIQPAMAATLQEETPPKSRWHNSFKETENIILSDFKNIETLVNQGRLSLRDGADLKSYVLRKAFESSRTQAQKPSSQPLEQGASAMLTAFETQFPSFFEAKGRNSIKDYILKTFSTVGIEQISNIAELVEQLEDEAVARYKTQQEQPQRLKAYNEQAKSRLTSLSSSASNPKTAVKHTFTRAEISKMNSDTFLANEKEIMAQMRRGELK